MDLDQDRSMMGEATIEKLMDNDYLLNDGENLDDSRMSVKNKNKI